MIELGSGFQWPDWAWYQWAGGIMGVLFALVGGLIVYAIYFMPPEYHHFLEPDETVIDVWHREIERRAKMRGRITKKMVMGMGFGLGMALIGMGVLWLAF